MPDSYLANKIYARSGSGVDQMLDVFQPNYSSFTAQPCRQEKEFRWSADTLVTDEVSVWRTQFNATCSGTPENRSQSLYLTFPLAGGFEATMDGRVLSAGPGGALLWCGQHASRTQATARDKDSKRVTLYFHDAAVALCLSSMLEGVGLGDLHLYSSLDLAGAVGRPLLLLARTMLSGLHDEQPLLRSPKALALLSEAALRFMVENIPHRYSNRLNRSLPDVSPRHVKDAVDFMQANMHRPLTITEVAKVCKVSARALQIGFQQVYDTTPMAYLRNLRLEAAHAELSDPNNKQTVGGIALKWGFTHLGRFSRQYGQAYGRAPSETAKAAVRSR